MNDKIKYDLGIDKVRKMKNPIILINECHFDEFKKLKTTTTITGERYTFFDGYLVKASKVVEKGIIVFYDDVSQKEYNNYINNNQKIN